MEAFTDLDAVALPLDLRNVDTDQLTPARFLSRLIADAAPGDMGKILFHDLRFDEEGKERPDFILNSPTYRSAQILVGDENFGCGSSRETAVWALVEHGFRAVIAPSFGDIFSNNAGKNGLLAIRLDPESCARIRTQLHENPGASMQIDLANQTVIGPDANGTEYRFDIDAYTKECLLAGLDDLEMILAREQDIEAHEHKHRDTLPWLYDTAN